MSSLYLHRTEVGNFILDHESDQECLVLLPQAHIPWKRLTYLYAKENVSVTGREAAKYHERFSGLVDDPTKQVIEVGPGMSEYVPSLVRRFGAELRKPIVIDPLNYARLDEFLEAALRYEELSESHARVREFRYRIRILTDSSLVTLYPLPLTEAVEQHSELIGAGDIVIDYNASDFYQAAEGYPINFDSRTNPVAQEIIAEIDAARRSLVAPGGVLFFNRKFGDQSD